MLLNPADLYILDEAFTGIDQRTKQMVITNLMSKLKDKTVILITHEPEETRLVDFELKIVENILETSD